MNKRTNKQPETSPATNGALPKKSYLFWANVFVVLPFAVLVMQASSTGNGLLLFWAFTIAPAALVTLGLDVYMVVRHFRHGK